MSMTAKTDKQKQPSLARFIRAIRALPSDKPQVTPGKWYRTQKEHWLGWLSEYHGPGAYGRAGTGQRDAQFAYNHIVEVKMLLWIIEAAGVNRDESGSASSPVASMQIAARAVRGFARGIVLTDSAGVVTG